MCWTPCLSSLTIVFQIAANGEYFAHGGDAGLQIDLVSLGIVHCANPLQIESSVAWPDAELRGEGPK